jgi:hypothetical protein
MTAHVKEYFTISGKLKDVFMEMEVSPVGVLKNYALNLIYNKIHQYEAENGLFEKKYGCSFREFKKKIDKMKGEENFEWEDSLMDWEFAHENLKYWQKKARELRDE